MGPEGPNVWISIGNEGPKEGPKRGLSGGAKGGA